MYIQLFHKLDNNSIRNIYSFINVPSKQLAQWKKEHISSKVANHRIGRSGDRREWTCRQRAALVESWQNTLRSIQFMGAMASHIPGWWSSSSYGIIPWIDDRTFLLPSYAIKLTKSWYCACARAHIVRPELECMDFYNKMPLEACHPRSYGRLLNNGYKSDSLALRSFTNISSDKWSKCLSSYPEEWSCYDSWCQCEFQYDL